MEEEKLEQKDGEQEWIKHAIVDQKLINISSITNITIDGLFQDQPKYYVNMPRIPIVTNHASIIELGEHG
jgi:hypothetical protein